MTAHLHPTFVDGCFRCDLGRDEEAAAIAQQEADEARQAECPRHVWGERRGTLHPWRECTLCGAEQDL